MYCKTEKKFLAPFNKVHIYWVTIDVVNSDQMAHGTTGHRITCTCV